MKQIRERISLLGSENLTNRELLSLLTGSIDTAEKLLKKFKTIEKLKNASIPELQGINGVGNSLACKINASLELSNRIKNENISVKTISNGRDVMDFCHPWFWGKEKEIFITIALNVKNEVIRVFKVATGSLTACTVHPREVFKNLIKENAVSFIVAHNHPSSGDPTPSDKDIEITNLLIDGGKMLRIPLLDHVVVGNGRFVSMKERGLI